MREMLETCFTGPVLPASILLVLVAFYWLAVIIGALDLDLFDFDLDLDGQADLEGVLGTGMVALRFLNIGRIPVMLWISIFALALWITSVVWYDVANNESTWLAAQVFFRNLVVAVIATKIVTQPMLRLIDNTKPTSAEDLIGKLCVVATSEANSERGQAKLQTTASPLLLNVRTREKAFLGKGDVAKIIEYDPVKHIYLIEKAEDEVQA
jgi:hypothetical protein